MQGIDSEIRDIPTSPIFGLDAILAIFFGMALCCCNTLLISRTSHLENMIKKLSERYPTLKFFTSRAYPAPQGAPRIHTDECCFCYSAITNEVGALCGHVFCGKCVIDFWESKGHTKLKCPLCRRDITMILTNFPTNNLQDEDYEKKRIVENAKTYNANFSNHSRTLLQIIQDAPYLFRRFIQSLNTQEGISFLLRKVLTSRWIIISLLYIISPLDLIPDYFVIIGWIDDAIMILALIIYITTLYYVFLRARN